MNLELVCLFSSFWLSTLYLCKSLLAWSLYAFSFVLTTATTRWWSVAASAPLFTWRHADSSTFCRLWCGQSHSLSCHQGMSKLSCGLPYGERQCLQLSSRWRCRIQWRFHDFQSVLHFHACPGSVLYLNCQAQLLHLGLQVGSSCLSLVLCPWLLVFGRRTLPYPQYPLRL